MLTISAPTEWARRTVRGAYDLHVHVEPDVMRRRLTDLQLARRCWDVGLAGFALKSHYVPTAERAAVVNEALNGAVQVDWAKMVANIRATGPEQTIITTDLGQPANPPVEDGLALMADALQESGFTDEEITTMIVANSRLLAGPQAQDGTR